MSSPPAAFNERPVATLRTLARLVEKAGPEPVGMLRWAVALSTLAALSDIASLALLQRGVSRLSGGGDVGGKQSLVLAGFLGAALLATLLRMVAQSKTVAAQHAVVRELAIRAFKALQLQDYPSYLRVGASAGFTAFDRLTLIGNQALAPFITVIVSSVSALALLAAVTWLYPLAGALVAVALLLVVAEGLWRSHAKESGRISTFSQTRTVLLYEARSAFRDIFLTNGQQRLCDDYAEAETALRDQQVRAMTAAQTSRHTVELAGLTAALVILLTASRLPGGGANLLPLLAVLALAALRLLPQVAALRTSLRLVAIHGTVTAEVHALLDEPLPPSFAVTGDTVMLTDKLQVTDVSVIRPDRPDTLNGLDLTVQKGARVGIRGASGTGKSTLLDVICGAIQPQRGQVSVDGVAIRPDNGAHWRDRIGVVSQAPVLLGRTLREAVVFPQRPEATDEMRFADAIARAGIAEMVAGFANGLDTPIGEAVAFLSGGQRQRLALAHALYRAKDLLILDEATGQLDAQSEQAIVAALANLPADLTLIIVSHREALFACCAQVYDLKDGKLSIAV